MKIEIENAILSLIKGETLKCYYEEKDGKGTCVYVFATDHSFSWSTNPPGTADSVIYYVHSFEDFSGFEVFKVQESKKKYWLWDVKTNDGNILKDPNYMDEYGELCNGDLWRGGSGVLIKKHENEWIEV